ncbi:LAMI_0E13652g1_1 [Lachancea mirantina]|uniref:26S proteasome complex subunit SEM1 n=1 Tax=Lachancea mirantina TaxID=1230905 RepID=A0A1G4JR13_9SACH|nr:LAMI_0E13652g1_1 [Lachancea mirantina]
MSLDEKQRKTLEEDDEFEDFPVDSWPEDETLKATTNIQATLWQEDWDDVEVDDDFTKELRKELEKHNQQ